MISWAWFVMYLILTVDLTHEAIKHGKKRKDIKHDFWISLIAKGILVCLIAWIAGGFT